MAQISICGTLDRGRDSSCTTETVQKYYQQFVLINHSDIDKSTIVRQLPGALTPDKYNISFSLKTGKTGYSFKLDEGGRQIFGTADKTRNETAGIRYNHKFNMAIRGYNEEFKAILNSLDKGSYVVMAQLKNDEVEVYGFENGLTTADYSLDIMNNGGSAVLVLQSDENSLETTLPLHFKSLDPNADFNSNFAN